MTATYVGTKKCTEKTNGYCRSLIAEKKVHEYSLLTQLSYKVYKPLNKKRSDALNNK